MKFAVIVIGYNRKIALMRLLNSLNNAEYLSDTVTLIISLDKSEIQEELIEIANKFVWKNGIKKIRAFSERQGLRKHVLSCGNLTNEYDAVIVLEDDLEVSPGFYTYAKQVVNFYENENRIAGISLYKHCTNVGALRPFEPANNGYDVFLMQFAQSWGQCWTRKMWISFIGWYNQYEKRVPDYDIPEYILNWDEKSWLKYYMEYIIASNMFFVYPQISLSTNHSDIGSHCEISNNDYQVGLLEGFIKNYRLPIFDEAIKYDAYFERIDIIQKIPFALGKTVCLDLYGKKRKKAYADLLITSEPYEFEVIKKIQLRYRPHEINCLFPVDGDDIFVYDLKKISKKTKKKYYKIARYDLRNTNWRETICHGVNDFCRIISNRIISLFKK